MVNKDKVHEDESEYDNSDEIDYTDLLENSNDKLAQILIKCIQCEQNYLSKIKFLKKTIRICPSKKEGLEESNNAIHTRI